MKKTGTEQVLALPQVWGIWERVGLATMVVFR